MATTVRGKSIVEFILESVGQVICLLYRNLKAFRQIPVIFLQEERSLKITGNDNPRNKTSNFHNLIPGNIFPDPL